MLLVCIDDLNDWVGALGGHPQARTPNLDRLAADGVLFARAYCAAPVCNASRVSALTGLRPSTTGVYTNGDPLRERAPDVVTLPQRFRAAGYRTLGGGKVFHGAFDWQRQRFDAPPGTARYAPADAEAASWDDFHAFAPERVPPRRPLKGWAGTSAVAPGPDRVFDWGATPIPESELPDVRLARWAADVLTAPASGPLFLAVGFYRPHLPWYVPRDDLAAFRLEDVILPEVRADDLADVPAAGVRLALRNDDHAQVVAHEAWRPAVQAYLASVRFADRQLGRVLDALDRGPHREDTVVVVWSDNGWHLGEKLHWRKFALWEEASHVPLVIRAPGAARGARCDRIVSLLDLTPTLLDLCDLPPAADAEGRSLVPLLRDPARPWPVPAVTTWEAGNHAVRTERWTYIRYADGGEELYDRETDPREWTNLAAAPGLAAVKRELARGLPAERRPPR